MRIFISFSFLLLVTFSSFSQKVPVQVVQTRHIALSNWQVLDEQNQTVFSGNEYLNSDTVTFALEANKKYILKISVYEVYIRDTSLYNLMLNNEPLILINSNAGEGDHLFPFFTGIKSKETKITGGTAAPISDFPWQVYYITGNFRCGGSIISGKWVITAAHCTQDDNGNPIPVASMAVKVGTNNPNNSADGKKYLVSEVIVNEGYNNVTLENDIALLHIKDSINYPNATPIKLLSANNAAAGATDPGVLSWVTGYGITNVTPEIIPTSLQKVQLPIVSNATASVVWSDIASTDMMAGYRNGNKDACSGDSGGPLVVPVTGEYKLAGIVSWGSSNCNTYGAYTRVSLFEDWIRTKTGIQAAYLPPSPVGDSIVCQGTASSEYTISNRLTASAYEWKLVPADAGIITGNLNNASVLWDISKTGTVAVMVRLTINNVVSDWSALTVNVVRNTRLITQSRDTAVCAVQPVYLNVEAEGYQLLYKWFKNNNIVQSGASNLLMFANSATNNSGVYRCEVSGSCGTVISKNINLTVYPLTNILSITPNVEVPFGNDVTLQVNAEGHDLLYQWEKDGVSIAGDNDASITLPNVNAKDIGIYQTIVKGTCGTKVSDSVYVYVRNNNLSDATDAFAWPTITNSTFTVALSNEAAYNVRIFSSMGRLIREHLNCHFQTMIDVSTLPKGFYVVEVSSGKFRKSIKIIKT
jgi:secreted trypsin-like serine protease